MLLTFLLFSASIDFIPNDVKLGEEAEQMILLTGPNVSALLGVLDNDSPTSISFIDGR